MNAHEIGCLLTRVGVGALAVAVGLAALVGGIALISWLEDRYPTAARPGKAPGWFWWTVIGLWCLTLCYTIGNGIALRVGWC